MSKPRRSWCTVATCWDDNVGAVLVALRKQFPDDQFRLGTKKDLCGEGLGCVLGLMPYPHPNEYTRVRVEFADHAEQEHCDRRRAAREKKAK